MEEAGQPQVEDADRAVAVEQDVGRLDVAVDQAGLVGVLQPLGRLADVVGGAIDAQRPEAGDDVLQADAVHVVHDQEVQAAVLVDVVGLDQVGMVQHAGGPGLAVETSQGRRVARPGWWAAP